MAQVGGKHKTFFALSWNNASEVKRLGLSQEEFGKLSAVIEILYKANVFELDRQFGEVVAAVDEAGSATMR